MDCAPAQLVPQGPGVIAANQGCVITGAGTNAKGVAGAQYLQVTYEYTRSHLWRNFAVVIAFTLLYILVTVWATETFDLNVEGGGALVFKKSKAAKKAVQTEVVDEEKAGTPVNSATQTERTEADAEKQEEALQQISESSSVFTWENVKYTVPYQGGERQLLNGVSGYAKPGIMVALVGKSHPPSSAKTCNLHVLRCFRCR
jgi:ATP-binding cassette subfamily G (WHITE) protein 2 (SNQ2)